MLDFLKAFTLMLLGFSVWFAAPLIGIAFSFVASVFFTACGVYLLYLLIKA